MTVNTTRPDVRETPATVAGQVVDADPVRVPAVAPEGPRLTLLERAASGVRRAARFVYRLLTEVP
jgi:hypothetical protein